MNDLDLLPAAVLGAGLVGLVSLSGLSAIFALVARVLALG